MQKLPDFIIVPYLLMEDKEITLVDERLYGIIYWFGKLKLEKCIASNKTLAELVKTTSATIQNSLTKLENKGFVARKFKDEARKHRLEIIPLVTFGKVSLTDDTNGLVSPTDDSVSPTDDTVVSLTDDQKKNIYNKKIKEDRNPPKTLIELVENCIKDFQNKVPDEILKEEVQKFILYWTERNPNGKKEKWEKQSTFDVKRRLATWLKNTSKWEKEKLLNKKPKAIW